MENPYQLGRDREVLHAEPLDLVVMLFEKAIQNLDLCLEQGVLLQDRVKNTEAILRELLQSLDITTLQQSGNEALATQLVNLYGFCLSELDAARTSPDAGSST
jgi:flagellin-specific chaperone FliS